MSDGDRFAANNSLNLREHPCQSCFDASYLDLETQYVKNVFCELNEDGFADNVFGLGELKSLLGSGHKLVVEQAALLI